MTLIGRRVMLPTNTSDENLESASIFFFTNLLFCLDALGKRFDVFNLFED